MESNSASKPSGDEDPKSDQIPHHPKSPVKEEENEVMYMNQYPNTLIINRKVQ